MVASLYLTKEHRQAVKGLLNSLPRLRRAFARREWEQLLALASDKQVDDHQNDAGDQERVSGEADS